MREGVGVLIDAGVGDGDGRRSTGSPESVRLAAEEVECFDSTFLFILFYGIERGGV